MRITITLTNKDVYLLKESMLREGLSLSESDAEGDIQEFLRITSLDASKETDSN